MDAAGLKEVLPFLIPLLIVDVVLLIIALRHILTHEKYKMGNRGIWLVIVLVFGFNFIGPIAYFLLGKENE